jgi:hypothetical protein
MKSNSIVTWVVVIAFLILAAVAGYFIFRPSQQVSWPPVPGESLPIEGEIVPPPTGANKENAKNDLERAMASSEIGVDQYRTDAVVIYPGGSAEEALFSAAPKKESFNVSSTDQSVMALYDRSNSYGNGPIVYEVSFSSFEGTQAILNNPNIDVPIIVPAVIKEHKIVLDQTWAMFVEGSCYVCPCWDGVCGCLVCVP